MASAAIVLRKLRTFVGVGWRRKMLVAEAAMSLFIARITILIFPFRRLVKAFGDIVPPDEPRALARGAGPGSNADQVRTAKEVGWAVRSTGPFMPFKSVCLQQAMAAHAMLRRRGVSSVMHLGAGRDADHPIMAHAWLDAAGVEVTGYPIAQNFRDIACFVERLHSG